MLSVMVLLEAGFSGHSGSHSVLFGVWLFGGVWRTPQLVASANTNTY